MNEGAALADTYVPVRLVESERPLLGNSELARLMRAFDWESTSIGAPEAWPQSLKTCVRIMLTSRQPMFVWWGERADQSLQRRLQGDRRRQASGGARPAGIGRLAGDLGSVGPRAETRCSGNEGTYDEALLLIMERNGYPGGNLLHLLLQPGSERRGRRRRHHLRQYRRHPAHHRRAAAGAAARTGEPRRGSAKRASKRASAARGACGQIRAICRSR